MQRTKTNKLKSSSLQVGLRCARQCAYGVLLRWLLLLCHSRHGRRPGPQKTTQQQHKRAASLGWGFAALAAGLPGCCRGGCCRATRTPDQQQQHKRAASLGWGFAALAAGLPGCCCGGSCCCCRATRTEDLCRATRTEDLLPGYSNRGPFAGLLEQRTFAGLLEQRTFAGLLPLLLRPLPFSPPPSPRLAVNHNARLWLLKNV